MKLWVLTAALVLAPFTVSLAADPPGGQPSARGLVPAVRPPVGTLAIDGVRGERADGLMDVLTISGNCEASPAAGAAAKVHHQPIVITKLVDKASPLLAEAAAKGKKVPKVKVKQEYMTFELHDVIISSYKSGGGGGAGKGAPTETMSLNFTRCTKQ